MNKKFLIIGHPRCGTGFTSTLFKHFGFEVGHELIERDGISSWFYAVNNEKLWTSNKRSDFNFEWIIQNVRNPFTAIPSIAETETPIKGKVFKTNVQRSYDIRKKYININDSDNYIERAAQSFLNWYKLIDEQTIDFTLNIEDGGEKLLNWFNEKEIIHSNPELPYKKIYNSRPYEFNKDKWKLLSNETLNKLDDFCVKHNYNLLSDNIKSNG